MMAPRPFHEPRRSALAMIHIARAALGMDEDVYRAMLLTHGKVRSAADLDRSGRKRVLDHMMACGWKPAPGKARAPSTLDREPYYQKIEALLADMQLPWPYAEAIAENITGGKAGGIQRLAWVRTGQHLRGIVAALAIEKKKRLKRAHEQLIVKLKGRGLGPAWCLEQVKIMDRVANPWPWKECLETLRLLDARLGQTG